VEAEAGIQMIFCCVEIILRQQGTQKERKYVGTENNTIQISLHVREKQTPNFVTCS
jgi:hypothetical protein